MRKSATNSPENVVLKPKARYDVSCNCVDGLTRRGTAQLLSGGHMEDVSATKAKKLAKVRLSRSENEEEQHSCVVSNMAPSELQ